MNPLISGVLGEFGVLGVEAPPEADCRPSRLGGLQDIGGLDEN